MWRVVVLVLMVTSVYGQEALSLDSAVARALEHSPMVRATSAGRLVAVAKLEGAKAMRFPIVQATEDFKYGNNPVYVFGSLLEQRRFSSANFALNSLNSPDAIANFRTSIGLRLPVFDQFQASTQIAQARIGLEQADAEREMVEQRVRFETISAYYGVVLAANRLRVSEEAVKSAAADVKRTRDLYESGLVVESDLLAAETLLAEFEQQRIEAESEHVVALAVLNTALGLNLESRHVLTGTLQERTFPLESQEEAQKLALANRPDYRQARLALEARQESIKAARGQMLPRVDLFGSFGNSGNKLLNGSTDFTLGVSLTFNIYDPGRRARLMEARAARDISTALLERRAEEIELEVARAYRAYTSASKRQKVAASSVRKAQEALRIAQDRHSAGLTAITEVLRAQTALLRAEFNLLGARYDYYIGYARLKQSTGTLTSVAELQ